MPRVDELQDRLGAAKFGLGSRLLAQVPVAEEDRVKTAFITPNGLFHFKVMPFCLNGAPSTFQRMMDRVLQGLELFFADYIDDIVIFGGTTSGISGRCY